MAYYPKNRIKTNQLSNPGEFYDSDGKEYIGKYYITYDSKFFTGEDNLQPNSKKIFKYSNNVENTLNNRVINTELNNRLKNINSSINLVDLLEPIPFSPKPTENDYKLGKITRYFAKQRKIRNFKFMEISQEVFEDITNRQGMYDYAGWDVISIFWQISGVLYDINVGGIPSRAGVIDTNKRIVEINNKKFIGLSQYLTNFKEFYKE